MLIDSLNKILESSEGGFTTNIATTSLEKAKDLLSGVFEASGKSFEADFPDFDKDYVDLQKRLHSTPHYPRKDMPVIEPSDIKAFQIALNNGDLDIFKPYAFNSPYFPKDLLTQPSQDRAEFVFLGHQDGKENDERIKAKRKKISGRQLFPTQNQIWLDKIAPLLAKFGPAKKGSPLLKTTIIVSQEGFILDGHHRYAQVMLSDPDLKFDALVVPLKIDLLLKIGRSYGNAIGNQQKEGLEIKEAGKGKARDVVFINGAPLGELRSLGDGNYVFVFGRKGSSIKGSNLKDIQTKISKKYKTPLGDIDFGSFGNQPEGEGKSESLCGQFDGLLSEKSPKDEYTLYHDSYTVAIQEMKRWVKRQGFEIDPEEAANTIGAGPRKPSEGNTNRLRLLLFKDKKPAKKSVHFQIYNRGTDTGTYELNMYLGMAKTQDYSTAVLENAIEGKFSKEDITKAVKSVWDDVFPNALLTTAHMSLGGEGTLYFTATLGSNNTEFSHGIRRNDPLSLEFHIDLGKKIEVEFSQQSYTINPENRRMAYGRAKIGLRKTKAKDLSDLSKKMKKIFQKTKTLGKTLLKDDQFTVHGHVADPNILGVIKKKLKENYLLDLLENAMDEKIYSDGTAVKIPLNGKMVKGEIVRFDKGDSSRGAGYVVAVPGVSRSERVAPHNIELAESSDREFTTRKKKSEGLLIEGLSALVSEAKDVPEEKEEESNEAPEGETNEHKPKIIEGLNSVLNKQTVQEETSQVDSMKAQFKNDGNIPDEKKKETLIEGLNKLVELDLDDLVVSTPVYVRNKQIGELEDLGSIGYAFTNLKGDTEVFRSLGRTYTYLMKTYRISNSLNLDMGHDDALQAWKDANA